MHVRDAAGAVSVAKATFGGDRFIQQPGAAFLASSFAIEHEADIMIHCVLGSALHHDSAIQHEGSAIRQALDQAKIVRHQQHGDVLSSKLFELLHAPAGENRVADCQRLIDNQDLGVDVNRGGKCQADIHAAGIFFHRPIDELADFGESFDARKGLVQFFARQSQNLAIQINIFAPAEFGIEAGA